LGAGPMRIETMTESEIVQRFSSPAEQEIGAITLHAFRCESCKEVFAITPRPNFCPYCGKRFEQESAPAAMTPVMAETQRGQ